MHEKDDGDFEYRGGTVSTFDFVDTVRIDMMYLDGLPKQLGYPDYKVYYMKNRIGKLEVVDKYFLFG